MNVTNLLGVPVRTEGGESLGHVHDIRGELGARSLRVTGLVVGRLGLLERLGLGAPRTPLRVRTHDVIPWSQVVRADRRGVVVRSQAKGD
jgi:sporulation protein YlmC with PRC-barrel domain